MWGVQGMGCGRGRGVFKEWDVGGDEGGDNFGKNSELTLNCATSKGESSSLFNSQIL